MAEKGPRPLSNIVIVILLLGVLGFGVYVTYNMAVSAAEGPSPPTAASRSV